MSRVLVGFVLVALFAPRVDARPGAVRIICEDGQRQGVVEGFGRRRKLAICDLDQSCDGICTLSVLTPRDARCLLVDPSPCEPHGSQPEASEAGAHCDREFPGNGVPVNASRAQRSFFGGRIMVRCRPSRRCTPTTTTTLPPGIPDLTGQWTLIELDATDDCPAAVKATTAFDFFPERHAVSLLQDETQLFHCGGDVLLTLFAASEVTADGFTFDTGECCSTGSGSFNLAQRMSGTLPAENGTVRVTEQWTFSAGGPPGGPLVCTRTAHAVMARIVHRCDADVQCLDFGGCLRCVGGICLPAVACR